LFGLQLQLKNSHGDRYVSYENMYLLALEITPVLQILG
jgi:hypothetical protein